MLGHAEVRFVRAAEGGADARYEASVLLHEAARAEERTLLAASAPSFETKLASAIERCGCLIEYLLLRRYENPGGAGG